MMRFLCREGPKFLEIQFPEVSVTGGSAGKVKKESHRACLTFYFSNSEIKAELLDGAFTTCFQNKKNDYKEQRRNIKISLTH